MRSYKLWYILGLTFMGIFILKSLSGVLSPCYMISCLIAFLISANKYDKIDD